MKEITEWCLGIVRALERELWLLLWTFDFWLNFQEGEGKLDLRDFTEYEISDLL